MSWKDYLPTVFKRATEISVPKVESYEIEERKIQAAESNALALQEIAGFLTGEGLQRTLGSLARSNAASSLLQGLTAHSGRNGLDARTQQQDAKEICYLVQAVFKEFEEKLSAQARGEVMDPELHDGEIGFKKWKEELKGDE